MNEISFMGKKYPLLNLSYAFNSKRAKYRNKIIASELLLIAIITALFHSNIATLFSFLALNFLIHKLILARFLVWEVILVYTNKEGHYRIPMVNFRDKEEATELTEAIQLGIKTGNFPDFLIQKNIIK